METFAPFSAEAWSYAGQMTLLGMGMVFAVLAVLWMILGIFKLIFVGPSPKVQPSKKTEKTVGTVDVPAPKAPAQPKPTVNIPTEAAEDDAVIAAVITAAVAAYMAEQGVSENGFRVVSFKRASKRAWNGK